MVGKRILVTGGAGFIGSNLTEALLKDKRVAKVRVLDDLSNGYYENIRPFEGHPKFEFVEGDICDYDTVLKMTQGFDLVSHQAALGSVPRSLRDPLRTTRVNIDGTVNVLFAAVQARVSRVVLACSSSTYGDSQELPKTEDRIGRPLSPYAVTKFAIELYGDVFKRNYDLDYVGLRYFNVFGPKQSPDNPYAAVIPLFCKAFLDDRKPTINGDGSHSRDFTYVDNAVQANILALFTENESALNKVYNVACGEQTTLNEMVKILREITGKDIDAVHGPERPGDIKHSRADISRIRTLLGYEPRIFFREGLARVYRWYQETR